MRAIARLGDQAAPLAQKVVPDPFVIPGIDGDDLDAALPVNREAGRGLARVDVRARVSAFTTTTNELLHAFEGLPEGTHRLTIADGTHADLRKHVSLDAGERRELTLALRPGQRARSSARWRQVARS